MLLATDLLEPVSCLASLLGAWLVGSMARRARWWGWVAFLAANVLLGVWAGGSGHWWWLAMYVGFVVTSIRGLRRDSRKLSPDAVCTVKLEVDASQFHKELARVREAVRKTADEIEMRFPGCHPLTPGWSKEMEKEWPGDVENQLP